jgi:ribosome-interacting GTPase 1
LHQGIYIELANIAAKTADVILIMLDATKSDEQRHLLEHELDAVGIRLNKSKPDIVFKKKTTGGVCPTLSISLLWMI